MAELYADLAKDAYKPFESIVAKATVVAVRLTRHLRKPGCACAAGLFAVADRRTASPFTIAEIAHDLAR